MSDFERQGFENDARIEELVARGMSPEQARQVVQSERMDQRQQQRRAAAREQEVGSAAFAEQSFARDGAAQTRAGQGFQNVQQGPVENRMQSFVPADAQAGLGRAVTQSIMAGVDPGDTTARISAARAIAKFNPMYSEEYVMQNFEQVWRQFSGGATPTSQEASRLFWDTMRAGDIRAERNVLLGQRAYGVRTPENDAKIESLTRELSTIDTGAGSLDGAVKSFLAWLDLSVTDVANWGANTADRTAKLEEARLRNLRATGGDALGRFIQETQFSFANAAPPTLYIMSRSLAAGAAAGAAVGGIAAAAASPTGPGAGAAFVGAFAPTFQSVSTGVSAALSTAMSAGEVYGTLLDQGVTEDRALIASRIAGALMGATSLIGSSAIIRGLSLTAGTVSDAIAKGATKALITNGAARVAMSAGGEVARQGVGAAARAAARLGVAGGNLLAEVGSEVAEELIGFYATNLTAEIQNEAIRKGEITGTDLARTEWGGLESLVKETIWSSLLLFGATEGVQVAARGAAGAVVATREGRQNAAESLAALSKVASQAPAEAVTGRTFFTGGAGVDGSAGLRATENAADFDADQPSINANEALEDIRASVPAEAAKAFEAVLDGKDAEVIPDRVADAMERSGRDVDDVLTFARELRTGAQTGVYSDQAIELAAKLGVRTQAPAVLEIALKPEAKVAEGATTGELSKLKAEGYDAALVKAGGKIELRVLNPESVVKVGEVSGPDPAGAEATVEADAIRVKGRRSLVPIQQTERAINVGARVPRAYVQVVAKALRETGKVVTGDPEVVAAVYSENPEAAEMAKTISILREAASQEADPEAARTIEQIARQAEDTLSAPQQSPAWARTPDQVQPAEIQEEAPKDLFGKVRQAFNLNGRETFMAMKMVDNIAKHVGMTTDELMSRYIDPNSFTRISEAELSPENAAQAVAQKARGMTRWVNGKALIQAFENADFTTFAHELMHGVEAALPERDIRALEEWIGKSRDQWEVADREQITTAWERFFMQDQAPAGFSEAVRSAFESIKRLFLAVYETLARLPGVEPSEDVRRVFEAMFSGEETAQLSFEKFDEQEVAPEQEAVAQQEPEGVALDELSDEELVAAERRRAAMMGADYSPWMDSVEQEIAEEVELSVSEEDIDPETGDVADALSAMGSLSQARTALIAQDAEALSAELSTALESERFSGVRERLSAVRYGKDETALDWLRSRIAEKKDLGGIALLFAKDDFVSGAKAGFGQGRTALAARNQSVFPVRVQLLHDLAGIQFGEIQDFVRSGMGGYADSARAELSEQIEAGGKEIVADRIQEAIRRLRSAKKQSLLRAMDSIVKMIEEGSVSAAADELGRVVATAWYQNQVSLYGELRRLFPETTREFDRDVADWFSGKLSEAGATVPSGATETPGVLFQPGGAIEKSGREHQQFLLAHERMVEQAVANGRPVPDRVLEYYAEREWAQKELWRRHPAENAGLENVARQYGSLSAFLEEGLASFTDEELPEALMRMDAVRAEEFLANVWNAAHGISGLQAVSEARADFEAKIEANPKEVLDSIPRDAIEAASPYLAMLQASQKPWSEYQVERAKKILTKRADDFRRMTISEEQAQYEAQIAELDASVNERTMTSQEVEAVYRAALPYIESVKTGESLNVFIRKAGDAVTKVRNEAVRLRADILGVVQALTEGDVAPEKFAEAAKKLWDFARNETPEIGSIDPRVMDFVRRAADLIGSGREVAADFASSADRIRNGLKELGREFKEVLDDRLISQLVRKLNSVESSLTKARETQTKIREAYKEKIVRDRLVRSINRKIDRTKVYIDDVRKIEALRSAFDLKNRSRSTHEMRAWAEANLTEEAAKNPVYSDAIRNAVKMAGKKTLDQMTVEELNSLKSTIDALEDRGRFNYQNVRTKVRERYQGEGRALFVEAEELAAKSMSRIRGRKKIEGQKEGFWRGLWDMTKSNFLNLQRILEHLDGGKGFAGPMYKLVYDNLNRGRDEQLTIKREYLDALAAAARSGGLVGADKKSPNLDSLYKHQITLPPSLAAKRDGEPAVIDAAAAVDIWMKWQNEKSRARLISEHKIDAEVYGYIASQLTDGERAFGKALLDFYNTSRIRDLLGRLYEETTNNPWIAEENYSPMFLEAAFHQMIDQKPQTEGEKHRLWRENVGVVSKNLDARTGGGGKMRLDAVEGILILAERNSHFAGFADMTSTLEDFLNSPKIRTYIEGMMGRDGYEVVAKTIEESVNPRYQPEDSATRTLNTLMRNVTKSILTTANTAVVNLSTFAMGLAEVGFNAKGMMSLMKATAKMSQPSGWAEVDRISGQMWARFDSGWVSKLRRTRNVARTTGSGRVFAQIGNVTDAMFKPILYADKFASGVTWWTVYYANEHMGEQAAREAADKAVNRYQQASDPKDLQAIYRSKNQLVTTMVRFTSALTQLFSTITFDASGAIKRREFGKLVGMAVGVYSSALFAYMLKYGRAPEDDEDWRLMAFSPITNAPYVGGIIEDILSDRAFRSKLMPDNHLVSIFGSATVLADESATDKKKQRALYDGMMALIGVVGGPSLQMQRTFRAIDEGDWRYLMNNRFGGLDKENR